MLLVAFVVHCESLSPGLRSEVHRNRKSHCSHVGPSTSYKARLQNGVSQENMFKVDRTSIQVF